MPSYRLLSSPLSPFGRKVKIAAHILGLHDQIAVDLVDTFADPGVLQQKNPLGKIPVLILPDGEALYDSAVIIDYLDQQAGGDRLIPRENPARFRVLRLSALADGIMEAGVLRRYELARRAPEERSASWDAHQAAKISRALEALEHEPPGEALDAGTIAVACALGYLDFRFAGEWRQNAPRLVLWLDGFATRTPAFAVTAPVN